MPDSHAPANPTPRDIDLYLKYRAHAEHPGGAGSPEAASAAQRVKEFEANFPGIRDKANAVLDVLDGKAPTGGGVWEDFMRGAPGMPPRPPKAESKAEVEVSKLPTWARIVAGVFAGATVGRRWAEELEAEADDLEKPIPAPGAVEMEVRTDFRDVLTIRVRARAATFRGPRGVERLKELKRTVGLRVRAAVR